jgi:hypothetical protein
MYCFKQLDELFTLQTELSYCPESFVTVSAMSHRVSRFLMLVLAVACAGQAGNSADPAVEPGWDQSFKAGATDQNGHYMGGGTIMHLVGHKGHLFAADSYWCDSRNIWYGGANPNTGWAQILRLDHPGGPWVVDLELGPQHLRPEILKSVTFRNDGTGKPLPNPVNLLLASAFSPSPSRVDVSLFIRNDVTCKWTRSTIYSGPRQKGSDDNYSVRAMCLHRDKLTGVDRLFLTIGSLGIFSGYYDDSAPGKIIWSLQSESGPVETRPLAIIEANCDLLFSAGRKIYRRNDGPKPAYQIVEDMSDLFPTIPRNATGGIRGLTAIPNPKGKGDSLIFAMWAGRPSHGDIYRLDPAADGSFTRTREASLNELMSQYLSGNPVRMAGAPYSDIHPVTDPATGERFYLIGFESWILGHRFPTWGGGENGGFYAGAMLAIRDSKGHYRLTEINGRITPSKPVLVALYCFEVSPFESDHEQVIYSGGLDANKRPATNMAWIFSTHLQAFLRGSP